VASTFQGTKADRSQQIISMISYRSGLSDDLVVQIQKSTQVIWG